MDDPLARIAYRSLPRGYGLVKEGEILPDDLIWNWCGEEWLRADDPGWRSQCTDAADCVAVARLAKADTRGYGSVRNYSIMRGPDLPSEITALPQTTLF